MGTLRNFHKSSSLQDKVSLKVKSSGTVKSQEGGSQPPSQRWAPSQIPT